MKNHRAYTVLNQIAAFLTIVGAATLLAGALPVTTGKEPSWLGLAGGGSIFIVGLIFLVLSDLRARLYRIEAKLGTLPKDDFEMEKPDFPLRFGLNVEDGARFVASWKTCAT